MSVDDAVTPVLWHLKVSHYNEKVRWTLDLKRVPHVRRALEPGRHRATARRLAGGSTLPVLVLGGEAIGDSSRIIAELERRHPAPALFPADAGERARALELEDFFDEQLGAYTRLLVLHHMLPDPGLLLGAFTPDMGVARRLATRAAFPLLRPRLAAGFGIDDRGVALAYDKVRAAGERFQAELGPSGYLVGDGFSIADLTLAALLAPAVAPEQFPYPQPQRGHPLLAPLREVLAGPGLLDWTRAIYERHRCRSAEVGGGAVARPR